VRASVCRRILIAQSIYVVAEAPLEQNYRNQSSETCGGIPCLYRYAAWEKYAPQRETMLASTTNALAFLRFGFGRGGGSFAFILLLVIIGIIVSALLRSTRQESTKS
jgi:hypothetical protein